MCIGENLRRSNKDLIKYFLAQLLYSNYNIYSHLAIKFTTKLMGFQNSRNIKEVKEENLICTAILMFIAVDRYRSKALQFLAEYW